MKLLLKIIVILRAFEIFCATHNETNGEVTINYYKERSSDPPQINVNGTKVGVFNNNHTTEHSSPSISGEAKQESEIINTTARSRTEIANPTLLYRSTYVLRRQRINKNPPVLDGPPYPPRNPDDTKKHHKDENETLPEPTQAQGVRTSRRWVVYGNQCDYYGKHCLRGYDTGKVCGRSVIYQYYTFANYCMLDYANCRLEFEGYQVAYMGPCVNLDLVKNYHHERVWDDFFLDKTYVDDF